MFHRFVLLAVVVSLSLPLLAYMRTVSLVSVTGQPISGATIYYREFTGRIDLVGYGPTGFSEEVFTTDATGNVKIDKPFTQRMPSAFASDYALIVADGYNPQVIPVMDLQNRIYLRPASYHQVLLTLPDGRPAAGATFIVTAVSGRTFPINDPFSGVDTPALKFTADENGCVMLPCLRTATGKDSENHVMINGIAFREGYVNAAVVLRTMFPSKYPIALQPAQQVRGVVTGVDGKALSGATIRCAEYLLPAAVSDARGIFVFNYLPVAVPPLVTRGGNVEGTLTLYVDYPGCARQGISLLPTSVKTDRYQITMEPLVTVTGKLIDRNTGEQVTNSRKYGYYLLVRHSLGQYAEGRVGSTYYVTEPDGTFTIQIPRLASLEVNESPGIRTPFKPVEFREGQEITLPSVSR